METIIFTKYIPLLAAAGAFLVAYIVIPAIIDVSRLKKLFDDPSSDRKLHVSFIPNLGGVGIFASIFIVFALSGYALESWSPYLAAGLTMLFFSGIKDDLLVISPYKKLIVQIAAVVALMVGGNLIITDLGGVFGFHEIPFWAGAGLTFFTMIVTVNAYNLIDGVDGLAGGIGVIASLFFGWWFWEAGMFSHSILALIVTGALLGFLRYNFQPASIFMGDTGSQIVGYMLAFFAVAFVKAGVTTVEIVPFKNEVPVLVLSVLIVPLYDTLRVFILRAYRGKSPFSPDRTHVHHQLIDMGFSHRATCYILYSFNLSIIGLTFLLVGTGVNILLGIVLFTTVVLFPTVEIKRKIMRMLGIRIPSKRQIQILEIKYGMSPVGKNENGSLSDEREGKEDKEFEELAV